jgi:AraC-like DNA-binding protein
MPRLEPHRPRARDEGGEDPLLTSLTRARDRMLAAERDLRLLIAYAREFTEPRPYRLEDLARAAGMSISGIRTAYDDNEIDQVASITGLQPRRRGAP